VTNTQALTLVRTVSPGRLILYILLTTAAWVIGWSLLLFNSNGNDTGSYLWYIVPFLCIAIAPGLVLALSLRARRSVLQNGEWKAERESRLRAMVYYGSAFRRASRVFLTRIPY